MTRYTQDGYNIKGPGLPEQGVCAVGPAELEAAFRAGMEMVCYCDCRRPLGIGKCDICDNDD